MIPRRVVDMESMKVAVMMGGRSAERQISINSGRRVLKALLDEGIDAEEFDPASRPLSDLLSNKFTKVYIALHGRGGEDGTIQGALELMGIPYTGSGVLGSAISMDKVLTKEIWIGLGLPTARHQVLHKTEYSEDVVSRLIDELGLPLVVKPAQEGSSFGVGMAENRDGLKTAIANAFLYCDVILVEKFIQGREFTVTILNGDVLPLMEIKLNGDVKTMSAVLKDNRYDRICPAKLSEDLDKQLRKLGKEAFLAARCSNYGRVDVLVDHNGKCYLLEINSAPGMTLNSMMPIAGKAAGYAFDKLVLEILKGAAFEGNFHTA